jgi:hypothetical protein
MSAQAPEENPAESQQSESLPEGNHLPSEDRRQEPIPQKHDHLAANPDKSRERQRSHKKDPLVSLDPVIFHLYSSFPV